MNSSTLSRRDFLRLLTIGGCAFAVRPGKLLAGKSSDQVNPNAPHFRYKYRTMSVKHLPELQDDIDQLKKTGKLSDNPTFQSYVANRKFAVPADFPDAKFIVLIAIFTPLMLVNFHYRGKKHEIMVSPQYSGGDYTMDEIKETVRREIIRKPGFRLEIARNTFYKRLSVRSGLTTYGRNNITYDDEFGSFLALYGFYTDFEFQEDNWREVTMMESCKTCRICRNRCPNKCITDENFVINAGRCVTLYNEISGEFPDWMNPDSHNALMGCMKCQRECPHNAAVMKLAGRLEDVTEEETERILSGKVDETLLKTLARKLSNFGPTQTQESVPILTRNLSVLLR